MILSCARALVAPQRRAPRAKVVLQSTPEEVAIAASQQFLSLAVLAVGEGAWASTVGGFAVSKAIQCVAPPAVAMLLIVGSSGAVGSGVAAEMAPGLAASTVGCMVLLGGYGLRLGEKQPAEGEAPPKELIGLMFVLAFFGFSTAVQSFFASGIASVPSLPSLPGFGGDSVPEDLPF